MTLAPMTARSAGPGQMTVTFVPADRSSSASRITTRVAHRRIWRSSRARAPRGWSRATEQAGASTSTSSSPASVSTSTEAGDLVPPST